MSTNQAMDLVDQFAELGVLAVSLTGGEPFLRKDWHDIAARVKKRGMKLRFASNGHLVDENIADALVALGTESLSVSLDGVESTHNLYRHGKNGPGTGDSFAKVIAAMDRLRETPIITGAITTVHRQNIDELPQIHAILKEHGVQKWIVQLAHKTGRLAGSDHDLPCRPIAPEQLVQVAKFIVENSGDRVLAPKAFNSIGYFSREEPIIRKSGRKARNPLWKGCTCGKTHIGIEPDGGVKGCANQVGAPFVVGNVQTEPLRQIWEDRPRWHWLDPKPEQMTGQCAGCKLAKFCMAGCTTLAYRSTGELFNNPYCLRKIEQEKSEVPK